eukprot:5020348-Amphidinium_carterae.1
MLHSSTASRQTSPSLKRRGFQSNLADFLQLSLGPRFEWRQYIISHHDVWTYWATAQKTLLAQDETDASANCRQVLQSRVRKGVVIIIADEFNCPNFGPQIQATLDQATTRSFATVRAMATFVP